METNGDFSYMTEYTKRQLHRAEALTLVTTVVALVITLLLVSTNYAIEGNPLTALAIQHGDWVSVGVVAIGATGLAFTIFHRAREYSTTIALTAASVLALSSIANAVNDIWILYQTGIPDSFYADQVLTFTLILSGLATAVVLLRQLALGTRETRQISPFKSPRKKTITATTVAVLLVVSGIGGPALAAPSVSESTDASLSSSDVTATATQDWSKSLASNSNDDTAMDDSSGVVYVTMGDTVVGHNETGAEVFNQTYTNDVEGVAFNESGNTLFVVTGTQPPTVHEVNPDDGTTVSSNQLRSGGTAYPRDAQYESDTGYLYIAAAQDGGDGEVYGVNSSLQYEWMTDTANQMKNLDYDESTGNLYAVGGGGGNAYSVYGFDGITGSQNWRSQSGNPETTDVAAQGGYVYIHQQGSDTTSDTDDTVQQLDGSDGSVLNEVSGVPNSIVNSEGSGHIYVTNGTTTTVYNEDLSEVRSFSFTGPGPNDAQTQLSEPGEGQNVTLYHASGSLVKVITDDQISYSDTVSGQVVDQNGDPVAENTTVEVWGVAEPALNTSDAESLEQQADDLLDDLENPLPDDWDPHYDLEDHQSGEYLLVHESGDWGRNSDIQTAVDSQIDSPQLQPSTGQPVILSVWDATDTEYVGNPVINSFPGTPQEQSITVEQLSPSGEVTDTTTYDSEVVATTGNSLNEQEHHGVRTQLPEGIYRAYPEGSPGQGYVFIVGDADELSNRIEQDIRDDADRLTQRAEDIRSRISNDEVVRRQTTTDANGEFTVSVPQNVVTVQMQAYRADGQRLQNVQNASMDDLRDAAEGDYNGTFILPSPQPDRANPPAENVTVRTIRSPQVPNVGMDSYADLLEWWRNQRLNDTIADLEAEYEQRLENQTRAQVEALYNDSRALIEGYPPAREQFLDNTRYDEVPDPGELTTDELRSATREMQSALYQADRLQMEEPELDVNVDVDAPDTNEQVSEISGSFPVPDNVDEENVAVQLIWSNGSLQQMPDEYWSISPDGLTTDRTVEVEAFPMSTSDAAVANIRVRASSEDGVAEETARVVNPQFDGNVPDVQAIDLNTLRPGVNERVTFSVRAEDGTGYGSIQAVDVFAPDGTNLPTTINASSDRVRFDPASQGTHFVRVEYTNQGGTTFVETFQVRAEESSSSNPPTMRVSNGPSGTHALVGEGFRSAQVEEDGNTLRLGGVIPGDANSPGQIVVEPQSAMQSSTDEMEIRVLRGDDRETVRSHIAVELHVETFEDDVLLWRGNDPITHDGDTQFGEVEQRDDNKHVIHTVTNSEGVASIEMVRDPSIVQRTEHWMVVNTPVPRSPLMILDMVITYLINLIPTLGDLTASTTGPAAGEADATKTAHPMGVTA